MEPFEQSIFTADSIEARAKSVRCEVVKQVRNRDPKLASMLDDLFPDIADQAEWLFRALYGRKERPIDLIVSQRGEEVEKVIASLLYGILL